jgi:hypothetical protein
VVEEARIPDRTTGHGQATGKLSLAAAVECTLFSSPDPKGHVSYCHHLASVVRRKLFQKSSPLKVQDQWKPNLV